MGREGRTGRDRKERRRRRGQRRREGGFGTLNTSTWPAPGSSRRVGRSDWVPVPGAFQSEASSGLSCGICTVDYFSSLLTFPGI